MNFAQMLMMDVKPQGKSRDVEYAKRERAPKKQSAIAVKTTELPPHTKAMVEKLKAHTDKTFMARDLVMDMGVTMQKASHLCRRMVELGYVTIQPYQMKGKAKPPFIYEWIK